jgi:pyruvate,water dikinase
MVNLSQTTHLEQTAALPVDGVGLLRSELLTLSVLEAQSPHHWLQHHSPSEFVQRMAAAIRQFAQAFQPRPVFYRTLDLRPHEWQGAPDRGSYSDASVLGLRGTFSYQLSPELFQLELAAIAQVQQAGYANLRLLLPFVRAVEEFVTCRQYVEQAGLMQVPDFQLWIMAEVPAVMLLLPDFVNAGVQGISIGTNDLTQLLLGVHRDQPELASVFNERHPAVQRAIAHLIQQSQQLGIPCSICGEAPSRNPDLVKDLVEWGINAISVAPEAVARIQAAIVQAEALATGTVLKKEF